jgi:hypothetical protein
MTTGPFKTVTFGGKEYKYDLGFNELAIADDMLGGNLIQQLQNAGTNGLSLNVVRVLYYVGLKKYHHHLTIDRVGELIGNELRAGDITIETLAEFMSQAFADTGLSGGEENPTKKSQGKDMET